MYTEPTLTPAAIVGEVVAGEAFKTRHQLEALITTVNASDFEIGALLHTIKKNGFYTGYNTFQEYVKTLKLRPRKALYMRKIAEVMDAVNIPREEYEKIGKAKLRHITSLNPTDTYTDPITFKTTPMMGYIVALVVLAPNKSVDEIAKHVRTLKGQIGDDDIEFMRFAVTRATANNVIRPALAKAKMLIGSVTKDDEGVSHDASDSRALEIMAVEFLQDETYTNEFIQPEEIG